LLSLSDKRSPVALAKASGNFHNETKAIFTAGTLWAYLSTAFGKISGTTPKVPEGSLRGKIPNFAIGLPLMDQRDLSAKLDSKRKHDDINYTFLCPLREHTAP
jgi:hypothetical protein